MPSDEVILHLRDVRLAFGKSGGATEVLHGVGLHVRKGEKVALVGESGSGKSVTARLILGLLQEERGVSVSGSIRFVGEEIAAGGDFVRDARGRRLTMIFQDPSSALNPTFTIMDQFHEVLRRANPGISRRAAHAKASQWLTDVLLRDPDRVLSSYVFQLSGGMSQRVMIAMALANDPALLIADEPGTALDVSVQAQTLKLMEELATRLGTAVLFISHNLGVVREFADRVYVIYRGRIVEHGGVEQIFANPLHPYTRALLRAVPKISEAGLPDLPEFSEDFLNPRMDHPGCVEPADEVAS
jgi:ABC-type dipeptide/oligopeptide/nickel transport system ATPase component